MNSLSVVGKNRVMNYKDDYTVGIEYEDETPDFEAVSGVLLFKVIVRQSHIDSNATTASIRRQMTNLPTYIEEIGYDIIKFNEHVKLLTQGLSARGEESTDLLTHLFSSYKAVKDSVFSKYVLDKEGQYEEGKNFSPEQLMLLMAEKYKILVSKQEWMALSEDQEKLVALEGVIDKMSLELKKNKSTKKTSKDGKKPAAKKEKKEKPEWFVKNTPPEPHELRKPRKWGNKLWYWCSPATGGKCEGNWRVHKPVECRGTAKKRSAASQKPEGDRSKKAKQALQARISTKNVESSDSEDE